MLKFSKVIPLKNYVLEITLNDGRVIKFDVETQLELIPAYKKLYDVNFFNTVKCSSYRIYWNDDYDFHIHQVLEACEPIL